MSERPSEHFTWDEFACRDGSPVPLPSRPAVRALCRRYLEPLRRLYGPVTVLSGHRTLSWNRAVGGAPRSQHVYGLYGYGVAADVRCERGTPSDWYRALDELGAGGVGLYDGHVHVDNRHGHARW